MIREDIPMVRKLNCHYDYSHKPSYNRQTVPILTKTKHHVCSLCQLCYMYYADHCYNRRGHYLLCLCFNQS